MARRGSSASEAKLRRGEGYWLWVGGPVAPGAAATTLGPLILIRRRWADDAELLRHEVEHVHQWRRHGVFGFLRRYLGAYVRARLAGYPHWAAYRRIPFEIEAEWAARLDYR
ncbi:MAG: hypothetical protein WKF43_08835 [Acidimicrobiales bacterium]